MLFGKRCHLGILPFVAEFFADTVPSRILNNRADG